MNDKPDMAMEMPLRVGIIMDHPSPHMVSLLNTLAEEKSVCAEVIYLGEGAPEDRKSVV